MNTKYIQASFFSILLFFSVSCKEAKKEAQVNEKNQMEKVMDIHDEVMPKMGEIGSLVGKLKSKIDTTTTGIEYEKAIRELQDANTSMMNWMQGFGKKFDSDEIMNRKELTTEKQEWLNEEEEKVNTVKEKINSSITKAEALLGQ